MPSSYIISPTLKTKIYISILITISNCEKSNILLYVVEKIYINKHICASKLTSSMNIEDTLKSYIF